MIKDVVVGLDSSTTATKAIAWNGRGEPIAEARIPLPLSSPCADWYEQDPADWWSAACSALRSLHSQIDPARIAALAISNQRETFVPLAADGTPVRPAILWMDRRCQDEVAWLADRVGRACIHEISGKPPDMAPVAYRLAWMLRHEPEAYRRTAMFADVNAYLTWRLTGRFVTSWASADPLGLFDLREKQWHPEILAPLELDVARLPALAAPGAITGRVNDAAARATGLAVGTPVVACGGDGQAAGLGVNALGGGRAYLNLGTAVVAGVFSAQYRTGNAWRTMSSCSGDGYILETSLRSGTFLIDWFLNQCGGGQPKAALRDRLDAEAAHLPIGSGGLLAVPYWGAVMTPYWDPDARGVLLGLTGAHTTAHMYLALLEGIAMEQALVTSMIEEDGEPISEFIAMGGGAASRLWRQIIADVTAKPLRCTQTLEASSLGAAMCAATGTGWFPTVREAATAMSGESTNLTTPDPHCTARYAELLEIYRGIYPQLRETFARLAKFED